MGNLLWAEKKRGTLLELAPATAVEAAIAAGGDRAIEWAGYVSSRSPYSYAFWLGQAVARSGLPVPYPIDRAADAESDAFFAKLKARELKTKKGKK